jgi:hypothetical protein
MFLLIHNEHITDWRKGLLLMHFFEIMAGMADLKRAKVFASMAYVAFAVCEGADVSFMSTSTYDTH